MNLDSSFYATGFMSLLVYQAISDHLARQRILRMCSLKDLHRNRATVLLVQCIYVHIYYALTHLQFAISFFVYIIWQWYERISVQTCSWNRAMFVCAIFPLVTEAHQIFYRPWFQTSNFTSSIFWLMIVRAFTKALVRA